MNCPFCNKPGDLYQTMGSIKLFLCANCFQDWNVDYNQPIEQIQWIAIFNDNFIIDLNLIDKTTAVFDCNLPKGKQMCTKLNYLAKVNPTNVKQWLDRILLLKVFH